MLSVFACTGVKVFAQVNTDSLKKALAAQRAEQQRVLDSAREERARILDSTRTARQRILDSTRTARQHILDSTRAAQKAYFDSVRAVRDAELARLKEIRERRADSLAAIRKYKESRHYKDSVERVKQARLDSIKTVREARLDSIKAERKRVTDSIVAVRKAYTDSIKAIQKKRSDSLSAIREYRQSKRYKDSVQVVRKLRLDSIKSVRQAYYDSIATERKQRTDSIAAVRKAYTDSLTAAREAYTDSIKLVRQARTDSLAKLKEKREKDKKVREKNREDKAKLALELKIKKKQEAYNNENMLKKRWGFPRSVFQNTFTRFNYYFNADQKMDEALENMQRFRRENYDSLLALYPFDPDRDSAVLAPDMDSIIQKASLGIQIHDPRTKWGDDLYLLLGQAYYYKGDYKNSSDAFKYVVSLRDKKKKKKGKNRKVTRGTSVVQEEKRGISGLISHKSVHNEAILWLSRVLTQQDKEGEAESVLDLVETDPNFTGSLSGRVALEKSFIRLNQEDYRGAVAPLKEVSEDKKLPDWIRIRAAYINGQLQQRFEDYTASANSFKTVQDLHPSVDMDFYAKKNMATSLMLAGGEQKDAVALLKDILKDGKYNQYYEQVYYLLGRLSVNGGDEEGAIAYLKKGIDAPKSTAPQKAMSYATLGNIYYDQKKYEPAKDAYDSAAVYMGDTPDGDLMNTALRRSVVLGNLTGPLRVIRANDSLLALSDMDEREQRSVVRKYIKMLEDRRADSIFQAENAGLTAALKNLESSGNRKGNYANWYFTNPAQMQKGYNDFKQKWGNRQLADDWRRGAAGVFAQGDNAKDLSDGNTNTDANGIPTEESLMAAIPSTPEAKDSLKALIKKAYVDGANAYVKDLEDYPPAVGLLDTLDVKYPKHEYDAEVLYLRYVIALKQGKFDDAKKYSEQLRTGYSDTKWAALVKPTEDGAGMDNKVGDVVAYYDMTYGYMIDRRYDTSLVLSVEGQRRFDVPAYKDRFQIIEAVSHAMLADYKAADSVLTIFITNHKDPNDSLRRWADAVLKYVGEKRKELPVIPAAKDTSAAAAASGKPAAADAAGAAPKAGSAPAGYVFNASEEHRVLFVFKVMESKTKGVQAAIEDFNKLKFGSLKLQTDIMMFNSIDGVIAIKSFDNKNQAVIYMNTLKKTKQIFREYEANEYEIVMISSSNFNRLAATKNIDEYLRFYKSKY